MDASGRKNSGNRKDTRRYAMYDSVIANRTEAALQKMEAEFEEIHKEDDDKDLILYVHKEALRLGHTPREKEIAGWTYLVSRFGSWDRLLAKASLKPYVGSDAEGDYTLAAAEEKRQKEIYKEKKREKARKAELHRQKMKENELQKAAYLAAHPECAKKKRIKKSYIIVYNSNDPVTEPDVL